MTHGLDIENRDKRIFDNLHRALQRARSIFSDESAGLGLTLRQLVILHAVAAHEQAIQSDIVSLTGMDRSTITELITRMVQRGLLARQRNPLDARAYHVTTTDKGRAQLDQAERALSLATERFLDAIPSDRRDDFVRSLALTANIPLR